MSLTDKLIVLADALDGLNLNKHADVLDQITKKVARDEDFSDLMKLWDKPVELKDDEESVPVRRQLTQVPEDDEVVAPLEDPEMLPEEEARLNRKMVGVEDLLPEDYTDPKYHRLDNIKRRHELMKLKKMLEQVEVGEKQDDMEEVPALKNLEPVDSFEDEPKEKNPYISDEYIKEDDEATKEIEEEQDKLSLEQDMDEWLDDENNADDDPFDDQLLQDEPGYEPYKGLSLKKMLKERPSYIEPEQMSDEELQDLRTKENKKQDLTDRINDYIAWHQKTDGLVEDPRSARKIGQELRLEIEEALEEGMIDEDYAKLLHKGLSDKKIVSEAENDASDGLLDALKDAADKAPEALKKVLQLIKDNPELMQLALTLL